MQKLINIFFIFFFTSGALAADPIIKCSYFPPTETTVIHQGGYKTQKTIERTVGLSLSANSGTITLVCNNGCGEFSRDFQFRSDRDLKQQVEESLRVYMTDSTSGSFYALYRRDDGGEIRVKAITGLIARGKIVKIEESAEVSFDRADEANKFPYPRLISKQFTCVRL